MPLASTPPRFVTLVLLTASATLTLNMFLPSLPSIARDLDADLATVSIAVSGYLAMTAMVLLVVGPLSDRIGRRPVVLGVIVLFTLASFLCALAEDIVTFLVFRMLQAGMISGYAMSLAIVRDVSSEQKAAGLLGYISMSMAVAPMLGPMVGGLIDSTFGWRANFHAYSLIGLCLLALCLLDLGETRISRPREAGGRKLQALDLLREPGFWACALCTALSTGAFYIFLTGAPLVAVSAFGLTTAQLGVGLGSITAGFMTGGFLATRLARHFPPVTMMLMGRFVACIGLAAGLVIHLAGSSSVLLFFGSTIFVGLGNGITMPGSNASALSVRPDLAGSAAGVLGAMTVAFGAILTALTGTVLSQVPAADMLLLLMLGASGAGLLSAYWALKLGVGKPAIEAQTA